MTIAEISREVDTVVINYKEFQTINKAARNNVIKDNLNNQKLFFPFKNFVLKVEGMKNVQLYYLVELDSYNPVAGGRITSDNFGGLIYKRDFDNSRFEVDSINCPKEVAEHAHVIVLGIIIYICLKSRERITKVSPQVTRKERENYEYKPRECFLLNDIVKYVSIHPNKSSIKYRCECWGVRGHIRHMADGRTIFIKPYKKGKKRDILEPKSKTYLLTPESVE